MSCKDATTATSTSAAVDCRSIGYTHLGHDATHRIPASGGFVETREHKGDKSRTTVWGAFLRRQRAQAENPAILVVKRTSKTLSTSQSVLPCCCCIGRARGRERRLKSGLD